MEAEIPASVDGPEIDEAWVQGDTVELFAVLTVEERQFVKMKWHDRLFDDEIAKRLRVSLNEVRAMTRRIKVTLAQQR
jgi:DNA-directed RNA polymerase specialized sigma24 family protein